MKREGGRKERKIGREEINPSREGVRSQTEVTQNLL